MERFVEIQYMIGNETHCPRLDVITGICEGVQLISFADLDVRRVLLSSCLHCWSDEMHDGAAY